MACTDGGSEVNISHKWEHSGMAQLLVQVFSPDFKTFPLGCNRTSTRVAGREGGREGGGGGWEGGREGGREGQR